MADLAFELDDKLIWRLEAIARGRGVSLEDYLRDLIHNEVRLGRQTDPGEPKPA